MKSIRLFLIFISIISFSFLCKSQTFDRRDYGNRDNFILKMKFSKEFQTDEQRKCRTLSTNYAVWHYADTVDFSLSKTSLFRRDSRLDSIKLDTVFTKDDYNYIMSQFNYYRDKGTKLITAKTWDIIKPNPKKPPIVPYWEISQALYSQDYTKCVVIMNFYASSSDRKLTTALFYKNKKGDWIEKAVLDAVQGGY